MIKSIAIALLAVALVGHVSAEEEASQETSLLMGNAKLFSKFCLDEREGIKADIKVKANQKSSQVYSMFFNQFVVEIADEVMDVTREEVERFTQQLKTPPSLESAPSDFISENEIEERLEDTKVVLEAQPGLIGRLRNAATSVAGTIYKTVNSALYLRLAKLRTMMSKQTFVQSLVDACEQIKEYEEKLESDLAETKKSLAGSHDQPEVQEFIESVSVRNLQCQTTRAISRLQGFCTVVISGGNFLLKAIGSPVEVNFPAPSSARN